MGGETSVSPPFSVLPVRTAVGAPAREPDERSDQRTVDFGDPRRPAIGGSASLSALAPRVRSWPPKPGRN